MLLFEVKVNMMLYVIVLLFLNGLVLSQKDQIRQQGE